MFSSRYRYTVKVILILYLYTRNNCFLLFFQVKFKKVSSILVFQESDSSRNLQKNLGLTSYFCPVTLREYGVLRAGDPEIVAVHQNLIYYFCNEEARSKFMENPNVILNGSNGLLKVSFIKKIVYNLKIYFFSLPFISMQNTRCV